MSQTMKPIPFTQFRMPGGNKIKQCIERPAPIADKAAALIAAGWEFEAEVISTGDVNLSCSLLDAVGDLIGDFGRVVQNGPEVPEAVDEVVTEAYEFLTKDGAPLTPQN